MLMESGRTGYESFGNPANMFEGQEGYNVSCHCRNYSPRGSARTMNMGDYTSCDSCSHLRGDMKCGMAQQTLS